MSAPVFTVSDFSGDTRFGAAVARVRALETRLIPRRQFVRMAGMAEREGLLDELRGTEYADALVLARGPDEEETALTRVLRNRMALVLKLSNGAPVVQAMQLATDIRNLKLLLRQRLAGDLYPAVPSSGGCFEPKQLRERLAAGRSLPEPLAKAIPAALQEYDRQRSFVHMDQALDRFYLNHLWNAFRESGLPFLRALVGHQADLLKIRLVLRMRFWSEHRDGSYSRPPLDLSLFPAGGFLLPDKLKALWQEEGDRLTAIFQYTSYATLIQESMAVYRTTGDMWMLERLIDDWISTFFGLTRYTPFGIEPLVAHLWFSMQEVTNLRLILLGHRGGLDPETLTTRLRTAYHA